MAGAGPDVPDVSFFVCKSNYFIYKSAYFIFYSHQPKCFHFLVP